MLFLISKRGLERSEQRLCWQYLYLPGEVCFSQLRQELLRLLVFRYIFCYLWKSVVYLKRFIRYPEVFRSGERMYLYCSSPLERVIDPGDLVGCGGFLKQVQEGWRGMDWPSTWTRLNIFLVSLPKQSSLSYRRGQLYQNFSWRGQGLYFFQYQKGWQPPRLSSPYLPPPLPFAARCGGYQNPMLFISQMACLAEESFCQVQGRGGCMDMGIGICIIC